MRLKINLTNPTTEVPVNNQHELNGFIHTILGKGNPYHDTMSDYSISSLQGGKLKDDKKTLRFESNPYFFVASQNKDFLDDFITGAMTRSASFFGMKFNGFDVGCDFQPNRYCDDIITISPILIRDQNDRKITFDNPNWIDCIKENCIGKLKHHGIVDPTFNIELIKTEKSKQKCIWVGTVFNPCSSVRLKVFGKKKTRETLYCLGIGNSTGSGFGAVKIYGNSQ